MRLFSIVLLGTWLCNQLTATARLRYNYPLSSTRHCIAKSFLRPLRAGLRSNVHSSTEEHTGSESPPIKGSSVVKYNKRLRLPPLPVDMIGLSTPIPKPAPAPVSSSTSTSTFVYRKRRGRRRGNTADFIVRAVEIHGDQYDYSLSKYRRSKDKVTIICTRHDPPIAFEQRPNDHLSGNGCRVCGIARSGQALRISTADFIARAVEIHGDQYDYSLSEYGKQHDDKVTIICTRHDPPIAFEQSPHSHLLGTGCRVCGNAKSGQALRSNTADFIARAVEKHGDQYDYSLSKYVTAHDKVTIICTRHDPPVTFEQRPSHHLSGSGCLVCASESNARSKRRGTTADFIARAVEKHGDQYDYSLSEYVTAQDKVTIICTRHDPPIAFEQSPSNHLSGNGCRVCGMARQKEARRGNTADFVARAVEIHGDQYDYSLSKYGKTAHDKVTIICTRHDPPVTFEQRPADHLSGQGCRVCGHEKQSDALRSNTADFIARAVEKHRGRYDYSLSEYGKTAQDKVTIICRRHTPPIAFEQRPADHLSGRGCRECAFRRSRQNKWKWWKS